MKSPATAPASDSMMLSTSSCRINRPRPRQATDAPRARGVAPPIARAAGSPCSRTRSPGPGRRCRAARTAAAVAIAQRGDAGGGRHQRERLGEIRRLILRPPVLRHRGLAQLRLEGAQPGCAWSMVWPGASRAEHRQPPRAAPIERALGAADDRLRCRAAPSRRTSCPTRTPRNSGGVTPTIVNGWPSSDDRSAEHIAIAAVLALPESVTQDRDRPFTAAAIVLVGEAPADDRRDAERVEETVRSRTGPGIGRASPPAFRLKRA